MAAFYDCVALFTRAWIEIYENVREGFILDESPSLRGRGLKSYLDAKIDFRGSRPLYEGVD